MDTGLGGVVDTGLGGVVDTGLGGGGATGSGAVVHVTVARPGRLGAAARHAVEVASVSPETFRLGVSPPAG